MKKRLVETLEMALVVEPNIDIITDNMVSEWANGPYPQLSVLLVYLKFLASLHQNHHWTAKSDPFYGDHLLFERLYGAVVAEIDSVAEKAVGLGSTANVDLNLQCTQVLRLVQGSFANTGTLPMMSDLARRSYQAEMSFLRVADRLVESMRECGMLTRGVDNLIAGIQDAHEGHIYLLKQRIT
jgi:DNA-binding ferritin-like protein